MSHLQKSHVKTVVARKDGITVATVELFSISHVAAAPPAKHFPPFFLPFFAFQCAPQWSHRTFTPPIWFLTAHKTNSQKIQTSQWVCLSPPLRVMGWKKCASQQNYCWRCELHSVSNELVCMSTSFIPLFTLHLTVASQRLHTDPPLPMRSQSKLQRQSQTRQCARILPHYPAKSSKPKYLPTKSLETYHGRM